MRIERYEWRQETNLEDSIISIEIEDPRHPIIRILIIRLARNAYCPNQPLRKPPTRGIPAQCISRKYLDIAYFGRSIRVVVGELELQLE